MVLAPWSARARATLAALNIATGTASLAASAVVVACGIVAPGFTKGTYAYVKRLALCDGYVFVVARLRLRRRVWSSSSRARATDTSRAMFVCFDRLFALACVMGDRGRDAGLDSPSVACVTQGALIQFFGVASAVWTTCVSHACASSIKRGRAVGAKTETIGRYDAFVAVASFACLLVPAATQTFGDSRLGRCHIVHGDSDETSKARTAMMARIIGYYVPIWACVGYNLFAWSSVWRVAVRVKALDRTLWSAASSSSTDFDDAARRSRVATARLVTFVRRLALYPAWQVISNIPGTALRVVTLAGARVPLALAASHVVAKTSQGVAHCAIFFYAHPARDELAQHFRLALGRAYPASAVSPTALSAAVARDAEDALAARALADDVDFATDDDDDDDDAIASYEIIQFPERAA